MKKLIVLKTLMKKLIVLKTLIKKELKFFDQTNLSLLKLYEINLSIDLKDVLN